MRNQHLLKRITILLTYFVVLSPAIAQQKEINHNTRITEILQYIDGYYVDNPQIDSLVQVALDSISARISDGAKSFLRSTEVRPVNMIFRPAQMLQRIEDYYANQHQDTIPDIDTLVTDAIIGMLDKLDPHSSYVHRTDVADANQAIQGSFVGVGIRFQIVKDSLLVISTIENGPADKVGILAGDQIIAVDAENIAGIGLKNSDVRSKLLGEKGTKVKMTIVRSSESKPLNFTVVRDKIIDHSVVATYMVEKKIGYIKLIRFSRNSLDEIRDGVQKLKKQGMEDLIIDLQDNGGGLLGVCAQIVDEYLDDKKLIVYSEGRKRPRQEYISEKKGAFEKGRLILLINENSASASEIFSGAIQDWDRGLIVGRRTFGKGLVQQPINLTDGSEVRLTISRYYTPSGRFIQKPYENGHSDEYRQEKSNRYKTGELYKFESMDFPDSLKHETLIKNRTVYGGGGIMPDFFVPIDTSGINELFKTLARNGYFNSYVVDRIKNNRGFYTSNFSNFSLFKKRFMKYYSAEIEADFMAYVKSEKEDLNYSLEEYTECKDLLMYRIKSAFASNLFGLSESYEISNEYNNTLYRAIEILKSKEYNRVGLAD